MNKTAQIILNLIVGLVSFLFFALLMFPLDSMIGHFLSKLEDSTKGEWKVSVSDIDASLLFDTEFKDFRLFQRGKEIFHAPRIEAGVSLLPLISGNVNLRFTANYNKGEISGRVTLAEDSVVDLNLEKVNLKELTILTDFLKSGNYPQLSSGELNGTVYFSWSRDLRTRDGEVNLKIKNAKMGSLSLKALNMEIPAMELSQGSKAIELEGSFDRGQITFTKFNIPGPDLIFDVSGNLRLNRNNEIIRINIGGKFGFSDKVKQQVSFVSMLDGQESADGSFPLSLQGSAKKPSIKIGDIDLGQFLKF